MKHVAERLVREYKPLYAVADSIRERRALVPALAGCGVPSVALVHEFAEYVRPMMKMNDVLDWAAHVLYPANVYARSTSTPFRPLPGVGASTCFHRDASSFHRTLLRGQPIRTLTVAVA